MLSKDSVNLARRLLNPVFLAHSLRHWTTIFCRHSLRRAGASLDARIYNSFSHPAYMKGAEARDADFGFSEGFIDGLLAGPGPRAAWSGEEADQGSLRVRLASVEIRLSNGMPDWGLCFDDQEDLFSLHRLGWLLVHAAPRPSRPVLDWGFAVILDWCRRMGGDTRHPAWESYSVSERIMNILLFFHVNRGLGRVDAALAREVESVLMKMGRHLLANLEFHGELTNNHILNNARALYVLGRLSSCAPLAEAGRRIFRHETPRMITAEGFLREGSTSYHMVMSRSYLEALWAAERTGDDAFASAIRPVAASMVDAARSFIVHGEDAGAFAFPLFGDVTPDFSPDWLAGVCASPMASRLGGPFPAPTGQSASWGGIFDDARAQVGAPAPSVVRGAQVARCRAFRKSGWYRIEAGGTVLILRADPAGAVPLFSHGHNDMFSFVLYRRGRPVFIDPGRPSYAPSPLSSYSRRAEAHNSFTIDGFDSYPPRRYIYPSGYYRLGPPEVECEEASGKIRLAITHGGFNRIGDGLIASREFIVTADEVTISDAVRGDGVHEIKTFFHLSGDLRMAVPERLPGEITFGSGASSGALTVLSRHENASLSHLSGHAGREIGGWRFPCYGRSEAANTLVIAARAAMPFEAAYRIRF